MCAPTPPSTDPHSKRDCTRSGKTGLPQPPGHTVLRVRLEIKAVDPGTKGARMALVTKLISVTDAAAKGF